MGQKPSLIEINGQLYDAKNGRLFHHPKGPVIDGFMRKPQPSRVIKKAAFKISSTTKELSNIKDYSPAQTVHSRAQHSSTLMRTAVKKPKGLKTIDYKSPVKKARTGAPNPARVSRAMNAVRNSRVQRFGAPISHTKSAITKIGPSVKSGGAAIHSKAGKATTAIGKPLPSMVTSVSHQRLERMLDEALIRADSHKKTQKRERKGVFGKFRIMPRWMAFSFALLAVVSAATVFVWHNVPDVSMKVASLRAQVKGSMPAYTPSGFKFSGPIKYQQGAISMTYKDAGDHTYTLEQQASAWNSSSLDDNAVPDDSQVQTSQVKGTTVYYHSADCRATWVNDGKKFSINDHCQLDPSEIFKIAGSIL
ncbi:MAG TPA: DUF4367 domain-containing protein [Candidatus Saccharimonadales bacterium]|nr:DUF4367 domain-containing protein [Candidatus Saccharimonadales bacterium]